MKKLSIAVVLSAGMIHGCADSTVAFEQSKLMPGNGQVVSLTGTESEAVMTLTTRRKEYVFEGKVTDRSMGAVRFEGVLQNEEQPVAEVFTLNPYHSGGIWVCDGCGPWVDVSPVLMVETSSK